MDLSLIMKDLDIALCFGPNLSEFENLSVVFDLFDLFVNSLLCLIWWARDLI